MLYVFSGAPRDGDLGHWLEQQADGRRVEMRTVDIVKSNREDLTKEKLRKSILKEVTDGKYAVVVASPPCVSFSRARYSGKPGPPALRSGKFLRGFPRLQGAHQRTVKNANVFIDFVVLLLEAQNKTNGCGLLEHPEDLGARKLGDPGSIWRWPSVRRLVEQNGWSTGALLQSDWGRSFSKPTRLLYKLPGLESMLTSGWPFFNGEGIYEGPLTKSRVDEQLIGQAADGFATLGAAAWPSPLCKALAKYMWLSVSFTNGEGKTPAVGEVRGSASDNVKETEVMEVKGFENGGGRRKLTDEDARKIREGGLGNDEVYIGRGHAGFGLPRSKWANPFHIGKDFTREQAISKYEIYVEESGLGKQLSELKGKMLLCHCRPGEACHGDVLLEQVGRCCKMPPAPVALEAPSEGHHMIMEDFEDGLPARLPVEEVGEFGNEVYEGSSGWRGRGPPRRATVMGRERPFHDGGGLCSPGRWPKTKRMLPDGVGGDFFKDLKARLGKYWSRETGGKDDLHTFVLRLAAKQFTTSPFKEPFLEECLEVLKQAFCLDDEDMKIALPQCFRLTALTKVLRAYGDPDWRFPQTLIGGVPIGVDEELPRTPAVYEAKVKWALGDDFDNPERDRSNYKSMLGLEEKVQALFKEEEALGWMEEFTEEDARKRFGDRLYVSSLAVIDEITKVRVVHDATHGVALNHRIKVRDQVRYPSAGEVKTILEERRARGQKGFAILADASKAHRRVLVHPRDWGLLGCRVRDGFVWVNKVGTYGVGSAGYFWSRLAGTIHRLGVLPRRSRARLRGHAVRRRLAGACRQQGRVGEHRGRAAGHDVARLPFQLEEIPRRGFSWLGGLRD